MLVGTFAGMRVEVFVEMFVGQAGGKVEMVGAVEGVERK